MQYLQQLVSILGFIVHTHTQMSILREVGVFGVLPKTFEHFAEAGDQTTSPPTVGQLPATRLTLLPDRCSP